MDSLLKDHSQPRVGHNIVERQVAGKTWSAYKLIPPQVPVMPRAFEKPPAPQNGSTTQEFLI